jgi:hypothetical protein
MRMKRLILILAVACAARPREARQEPPPPPAVKEPPPPAAQPTPAPSGPQPMSRDEFKRFLHAVDEEAGDAAKLSLIKSAAANQWFSAAMAGVLIDHVVHRDNKLLAVPLLKDRILDKENAFWLYQHFTYREDKAKVEEMLEH